MIPRPQVLPDELLPTKVEATLTAPLAAEPAEGSLVAIRSWTSILQRSLPAAAGVVLAIGLGAGWGLIRFGSVRDAWLYASGVRVVVRPAVALVEDGSARDEGKAAFVIRNLTDSTINVLGMTTSCTCVSADKLPVSLGPGETRQLQVIVHLGTNSRTTVEQTVVYHTDHPAASSLAVKIMRQATDP